MEIEGNTKTYNQQEGRVIYISNIQGGYNKNYRGKGKGSYNKNKVKTYFEYKYRTKIHIIKTMATIKHMKRYINSLI